MAEPLVSEELAAELGGAAGGGIPLALPARKKRGQRPPPSQGDAGKQARAASEAQPLLSKSKLKQLQKKEVRGAARAHLPSADS